MGVVIDRIIQRGAPTLAIMWVVGMLLTSAEVFSVVDLLGWIIGSIVGSALYYGWLGPKMFPNLYKD